MKLKLDLHPFRSDGARIEAALLGIIDEACEKRAAEVEIIPGKGTGALKKTVLRFLDRPEIKARYHRLEKDSENWGRLFVHFRHTAPSPQAVGERRQSARVSCVCCQSSIDAPFDVAPSEVRIECPACGSPNRIAVKLGRRGDILAKASWGYDEAPESP